MLEFLKDPARKALYGHTYIDPDLKDPNSNPLTTTPFPKIVEPPALELVGKKFSKITKKLIPELATRMAKDEAALKKETWHQDKDMGEIYLDRQLVVKIDKKTKLVTFNADPLKALGVAVNLDELKNECDALNL